MFDLTSIFPYFSSPAREARRRRRQDRLLKNDLESLLSENERLQKQLQSSESENAILRSEVEKLAAVNERDRQRVLAETQQWVAKAVVLERDGLHREAREPGTQSPLDSLFVSRGN